MEENVDLGVEQAVSLGEPEREARCRARYCSQSDLTNTEELREGSGDGKVKCPVRFQQQVMG